MSCHFNVAGRHPGEGQLSVAKGCADGIVSDQRQKELLGISINILPILQAEANITQDKNNCGGGRGLGGLRTSELINPTKISQPPI